MLTHLVRLWFSPSSYYYRSDDPPLYCARQRSFIYCLPWLTFTILAFNYHFFGLGVLTDHHWFVSCLATTTYLYWLRHSPLLDKEAYFVCLLTVAFFSVMVWVFSLAIPHGMHLVIPTHPYFFWVVRHPNMTFLLKELEQEPHNRFSLLPTARPHPLLPLTHDPQLPVLAGYMLVMSRPFVCSTSVYVQNLFVAHAFAVV